jgi:hypothetical protein
MPRTVTRKFLQKAKAASVKAVWLQPGSFVAVAYHYCETVTSSISLVVAHRYWENVPMGHQSRLGQPSLGRHSLGAKLFGILVPEYST